MGKDEHDLEFRFRGGRLCLDFAATLGGRYRGGVERLARPEDLGRWFRLAMSLDDDVPVPPQSLRRARELREVIYRLVHPKTRDRPDPGDVGVLNECAARHDFAPVLGTDARSVTLCSDRTVEAGLATVARDAVHLLSGQWLESVRECGHPDCSLLFVDLSRPGQRRWCDMKSCGNRVKARRYRSAHRPVTAS